MISRLTLFGVVLLSCLECQDLRGGPKKIKEYPDFSVESCDEMSYDGDRESIEIGRRPDLHVNCSEDVQDPDDYKEVQCARVKKGSLPRRFFEGDGSGSPTHTSRALAYERSLRAAAQPESLFRRVSGPQLNRSTKGIAEDSDDEVACMDLQDLRVALVDSDDEDRLLDSDDYKSMTPYDSDDDSVNQADSEDEVCGIKISPSNGNNHK